MTFRIGDQVAVGIVGEVEYVYPPAGEAGTDGRQFVHVKYDDLDGDTQRAQFIHVDDVELLAGPIQVGDYLTAEQLDERDAPVGTVINDDDPDGNSQVWRFARTRDGGWVVLSSEGINEVIDTLDLRDYAFKDNDSQFFVEYVPSVSLAYAADNVVALTA